MRDWVYYGKLVDEKVADKWYNWEQAEKKCKAAKAEYNAAVAEKKAFAEAIEQKMDTLQEAMTIASLSPSRL